MTDSLIIVLSAIIPISLMLDLTKWLSIIGAILICVSAMFKAAFGYEWKWINYRTVTEALRKEIHYYSARIGRYAFQENVNALFVQQVESLISRDHTMWPVDRIPENDGRAPKVSD
jgi:hypothetical protein